LDSLELKSTKSAEPLLKALDTIRELNDSGKRKIPDGSPLNFVPKRWQKHVFDEKGNINRQYKETNAFLVRSLTIKKYYKRQYLFQCKKRQNTQVLAYFVSFNLFLIALKHPIL
jgi:hypothetical protein